MTILPKYDIVVSDKVPCIGIHILDGEFQGLLLSGNMVYDEDVERIRLDAIIVFKPPHIAEDDTKSIQFKAIIQEICNDVITKAINGNETRECDTEALNSE